MNNRQLIEEYMTAEDWVCPIFGDTVPAVWQQVLSVVLMKQNNWWMVTDIESIGG